MLGLCGTIQSGNQRIRCVTAWEKILSNDYWLKYIEIIKSPKVKVFPWLISHLQTYNKLCDANKKYNYFGIMSFKQGES